MNRKLVSGAIAACLALAILANMDGGKDLKGVDLGAAVNALNESLDFAELAALSVDELKDLIEVGAPGMLIEKSNAMSAVLNDAGITAELAQIEVNSGMDDIPAHYDVDIDYNGIEYEYKIDGATGAILEHEADYGDLPKVKNTAAGLRFSPAAGLYSLFTASHRPPYSVSG